MPWFLYILFCDQKTFYVGITSDIVKRLTEHKKGKSPYTKKFSDIKLVYKEKFIRRIDAQYREKQIKGWSTAKKKALIQGNKQLLVDLSKNHGLVDGDR